MAAVRAALLGLLLALGLLAGQAAAPALAQIPGPLAPPAKQQASPATPTATPHGSLAEQRRHRALVQALRQPGGWDSLRAKAIEKAVDFVPAVIAALLVLLAAYVLYRITSRLLHSLMRRNRAHPAVLDIGARLTKFAILGMGFVMAASQLGFQVGSVLAGLGIVGLALGLAAQDSLANLVAGITILWDHPFRIGDNVTVAGTFGQVKEIGLRTTRILTNEHIDAILPNKDIINQKILNHTLSPELRLGIPVGIGYGADIAEARRVLLAAVEGHSMVVAEPPPQVVVTELAESMVNLELRVWLREPHREREAFFALTELVKVALDQAGIEIPSPQRTVRLAEPIRLAAAPPEPEIGRPTGPVTERPAERERERERRPGPVRR